MNEPDGHEPRLRLPHPLILMSGCVFIAAAATWLLPAGLYDRVADAASGRDVVIAGSYHRTDGSPTTVLEALTAIPRGIVGVADILAMIFLIGGALTVIDRTGALGRAVGAFVARAGARGGLLLPVIAVLFAAGGMLFNMAEECVALVPVLMLFTRRLGYTREVVVMISIGSAALGGAFSHMNPFQVIIAQGVLELPSGSAAGFRLFFLALAIIIWCVFVMRYANRHRVAIAAAEDHPEPLRSSDVVVLLLMLATFAYLGWGIQFEGWDFVEMGAPFFGLAIVAGFVGGLGPAATADAFVAGARDMTFAGVLIGMARAIVLVLQDAQVVDTIVYGLFLPLEHLPVVASAVGMVIAHAVLHVPVSSVSGQAVLTMPILGPLADLLGMSRQVVVLTFQYGAGLIDMINPTNGALMAVLTAAGVRFESWIAAAFRIWLLLLALGIAAVVLAVLTDLS
ncbi:MAG: hypothetical protein V2I82_06615 [Halieaceae bacterium]|nr:hypothetical protein [Halieaceae bacterium]